MSTEPANLALLFAAISALGAVAAAVGSWASAKASRKAAEGTLFATIYRDYGTLDMLRALRILRNWKAEHGDEFEVKWKRALDANDPQAHEVDQARRKVKGYFQQALKLYQAGYADRRFVRELCSVDGVNILYDIVEPLEFALNPGFDRTSFDEIRGIVGRSGTRRLIPPVPTPPS